MSKYRVSITKVFGAAVTNTITVEAEDKYEAKEKALDANWEPAYWLPSCSVVNVNSSRPSIHMSDAYEIAKVTVDGETMESTDFNDHLLDGLVPNPFV